AAELVRAKTGRIAGAFQTLLMVMKGLPLAYAKDMQEDKEPLFDALDALKLDLADWLVLKLGLPFREAHHVTGRIVALADAKGVELKDLSLADLRSIEPKI